MSDPRRNHTEQREAGWSPLHATGDPINSPPFLPHPTPTHQSLSLSLTSSYCSASVLLRTVQHQHAAAESRAAATTMERPVAKHESAAAPRQQLPPGFRFHPTDEELVVQYLRRKVLSRPLPAAVIPVVHDVAGLDPWDLPGAAEGEGYFFSLRRAPATGGRRKRRAGSGYWKVTGKEKPVFLHCGGGGGKRHLLVGVKTALTFHSGEPSRGLSSPSPSLTGWLMHEYRLAAPGGVAEQRKNASHDQLLHHPAPAEWVVCRISLRNRSGRPGRRHGDGGAPASRASAFHRRRRREEEEGQHQQQPLLLLSSPPSPSSSSCVTGVTDITDQEEVSSGSSSKGAPAASQREA